jgi:transaldolase
MKTALINKIREFILKGVDETPLTVKPDPFWQNLRKTGTELWLDTGDIEEAEKIWSAEMTALTTNNTLLNNEIQKGIYDSLISEAREIVKELPLQEQIIEIAFILNARHGLRLTKIFGGMVSVELHTGISNDFDAIVEYGKRYFDISPKHFLVKVPYTATGLLGARRLRQLGIRINLTLEFSARQNVMVALVSRPNYLNVFLGRLGAYVKDNNLGDGTGAGERAVLATQKWVRELNAANREPTKLIAASLRSAGQLENLAGVDVFTMPVKVAAEGRSKLSGKFVSALSQIYPVNLNDSAEGIFIEKLWEVTPEELSLAKNLAAQLPENGDELIQRVRDAGCGDMFPELSEQDYRNISEDGKIPRHERWVQRIRNGELAIDTLLNLAGLASFTHDQAQLDARIKRLIG